MLWWVSRAGGSQVVKADDAERVLVNLRPGVSLFLGSWPVGGWDGLAVFTALAPLFAGTQADEPASMDQPAGASD